MIDIDIITKPSRSWASMHANTADGRTWMAHHIVRAENAVAATFPASFADEHAAAIRRAGLTAAVWALAEAEGLSNQACAPPAPREAIDWTARLQSPGARYG
jgi:hypothetical protein